MHIRDLVRPFPIVQGGMGVGISLAPLANAVSKAGGLGTISSAGLDRLVSKRLGRKVSTREAAAIETRDAQEGGVPAAVNIMVALQTTYEDSVLGAIDGGAAAIVSGAGMPLRLPELVATHPDGDKTALIPIVSSGRALRLLCKKWQRAGRLPDAAVVEGPLAGGHLGWRTAEEVEAPASKLENILAECLEVAKSFGSFPLIAAGGIFDRDDISRMLELGAAGVQMGTRFLATKESSASDTFKQAVVDCKEEDIEVAISPGSPCGLPFRILKGSPMFIETLKGARKALCRKGYVLLNGKCLGNEDPAKFFCICDGLFSAAGAGVEGEDADLFTVGALAGMVDKIMSVGDLMKELCGKVTPQTS